MKRYDVIICTYNGAYFISQQLESILTQTILPNKIIISDDNSSDNTLTLVKDICEKFQYANLEIIKGQQKGVVYNFLSAIYYATSDYIFFADQDDIWQPNKAEEFLNTFARLEQNRPTLVFSDASLIDEKNNKIAESFFAYQGINAQFMNDDSILYRNCVQGASCAINRQLQALVLDSLKYIDVNQLYMHDWWIALLARYYGQYQFIDKPLLEYRQHSKNQVGVFNQKLRFILYITRFRQYFKNFRQAIRQVKEFEKYHQINPSTLSKNKERKYRYISRIKYLFIKMFNL